MRSWIALILVSQLLLSACSSSGGDDSDAPALLDTYRLTTNFTTPDKPLGVFYTAQNVPLPYMVASDYQPTPIWNVTRVQGDLYKITSVGTADPLSLELTIEAGINRVSLGVSNSADTQLWQITPLDNDECRISPYLTGTASSLDIVNDDLDEIVRIADSGIFTGQQWQIERISGDTTDSILDQCFDYSNEQQAGDDQAYLPTSEYRQANIRGFNVLVNPQVDNLGDAGEDAIIEIDRQLGLLEAAVPADVLSQVQQVPIWLEAAQLSDRSGQYHVSAQWLLDNGYNPEKAGAVEISNVEIFLSNSNDLNASTVLHELAHARQAYLVDTTNLPFSEVYSAAVLLGLYESVEYATGTMREAYALTNDKEYFAELSEAYLATNDFFPFNREQLISFDPDGYELVRLAWGGQ